MATGRAAGVVRNVVTDGLRFRLFDAKGQERRLRCPRRLRLTPAAQVLGRLSAHIATVLQGKDKPTYDPSSNCGDVVVVVNAAAVTLTGNKLADKIYTRHTGYPGGLRTRTAAEQLARDPTSLLRESVLRMLPRNVLRAHRARKLRLFPGPEHPGFEAAALVPFTMPPRRVREKEVLPDDFELLPGMEPMNSAVWEAQEATRGRAVAAKRERAAAIAAVLAQQA